ncbi:trypsin zeta-like [Uranotaenia lowii]|uniref:trypsin zeta-like n=1 Tax=Uranotaenia lowii TaxID=190385 RepID=UPI002479C85B|nr:trypsin zeta-like [Uranotaenia lowii]
MVRHILLLAFLVGTTLAVPTPDRRIVGGIPVEHGEAPWVVSMRSSLNIHFCGGILLNSRFVLTASTCMSGRLASTTMAVLGSRFLNTAAAAYYGVQTIHHPSFNANTLQHNVALFQTIQNVIFTNIVQPIHFSTDAVQPGSRARMFGWGHTEFGGSNSNALQFVVLNVIDNDVCRANLGGDAIRVGDSSLCTMNREGQGICTNDLGGPLVFEDQLIGIAAWKVPCATGRPEVFVRAQSIKDWVHSIILTMLRYLVIFSLCCATFADEDQSIRIVGGREASPEQFPFMASLRTLKNVHRCGAAIISDRWLLTAAHCTLGIPHHQLRAVVGTIDLTRGGVSYNFKQFIEHPDYNEGLLENDISILETAYPIMMSSLVRPVKMATTLTAPDQSAITCGWGQTASNSKVSNKLQFVEAFTISNEECWLRHSSQIRHRIHSSNVCAYVQKGQGTCMGDSGGPMIVNGVLTGLVSWGVPCAMGVPDVYTQVASHRSWVLRTTGIQV